MSFFAQISEIQGAADYAAQQSDRWLFVALLVVFLFAMYFTVRWGMAQLAARDKRIDELNDKMTTHLLTNVKELQAVISHNSEVIHANTAMSEKKLGVLARVENLVANHGK